ncbi:hypothetical protein BRAS3843_1270006 [Bradyrhizobium sp. STM 3843]|nr:hypothetical protein BRAS3843_1270006 [Bradyrhizobium sp. STM 3843]
MRWLQIKKVRRATKSDSGEFLF